MGREFLARLRAATEHALQLRINGKRRADHSSSQRELHPMFSRLASRDAMLLRADAQWQPTAPLLRIEIMASGPFEGLRGIRAAVNRLQDSLVTAVRKGTLELRLTEVRRTCRHSTAWSTASVDPGADTTTWQCFVDAFASERERRKTMFVQAFRESLRNQVNHVVVFGDRFDDGVLFLGAAIRAFRRQGVRVSAFFLGDDFNSRNMYHLLAISTGGVFMRLSDSCNLDAVLPVITAFACGDRARLAALAPSAPEAR